MSVLHHLTPPWLRNKQKQRVATHLEQLGLRQSLQQPTGGRFHVSIKPKLRDGVCEWWAKVDDNSEQVSYTTEYSKERAEYTARRVIKDIRTTEQHEKQAGAEWDE